jgi:hypothetical protein
LVVECQAERLAEQTLDFGRRIVPVLSAMFPKKRIVLVPTSSVSKLGPALADTFTRYGRFRSVLVVGHSNAAGLRLTNDHFCAWGAVGRWLAKFEPEFLFLAACEAGRSEAVRELFAPIPSLREAYASPIRFYSDQLAPLVLLTVLVLQQRRIDAAVSSVARVSNWFITGGQLFRWRRGETGPGEELTGRLWDLAASVLNRRI